MQRSNKAGHNFFFELPKRFYNVLWYANAAKKFVHLSIHQRNRLGNNLYCNEKMLNQYLSISFDLYFRIERMMMSQKILKQCI